MFEFVFNMKYMYKVLRIIVPGNCKIGKTEWPIHVIIYSDWKVGIVNTRALCAILS